MRLEREAPPLARIDSVVSEQIDCDGGTQFVIMDSHAGGGRTLISPDIATCDDCLAELADPGDRRYRHPFISCTNCGPRFTIITGLPYDRPATTMAAFPMCAGLRGRVRRPGRPPVPRADGRLPRLRPDAARSPARAASTSVGDERRSATRAALLAAGGDPRRQGHRRLSPGLRRRQRDRRRARCASARHRGDKPFAVMVADLDHGGAAGGLSTPTSCGCSPSRAGPSSCCADASGSRATTRGRTWRPDTADLGVMLPYTPLHHLLLGLPGDPPGPRRS